MSMDEVILNRSFDSSEYDSYSLTDSIDSSPKPKQKKKRKLGIFHKSHKNHKSEKLKNHEIHDTGIDSQLIHSSSEVSRSIESNASVEYNGNEFGTPIAPEEDIQTKSTSKVDLKREDTVRKKSPTRIPPTHLLHVWLRSGQYLAARDSNGLSDPYVKFKVDRETVYKSKCCKETLNPKWDESFETHVHLESKVTLRVYDRDRGLRDDFMGGGEISLSNLEDTFTDVSIHLEDENSDEELGFIHLQLKLLPFHKMDNALAELVESTPALIPVTSEKLKTKPSTRSFRGPSVSSAAIATVQLVSGSNLPASDTNGLSDPYVRLSLGKQKKRKSKVCYKTLNPEWKEEFTFHLNPHEASLLELHVWDYDVYRKDDFLGRCEVDLDALEEGKTHSLNLDLIDTDGSTILLLITIHTLKPNEEQILTSYDLSVLRLRYGLSSTFKDLPDVGFAEITIISASGLRSADINGKSDPFCVVHLCNARAQTHTCDKTLDPVWNRTFTFPVHDIHDAFDIWIFDEDPKCEKEFLGRVCVPILRSKNGEDRTYVLKNRDLKQRAKGDITIRINYIYNSVRAAIRTFSPREEIVMERAVKWKKSLLLQNFYRVWSIVQQIMVTAEFINSCFTWENKFRSTVAFLMFLIIVWNFELYMLPIVLLMLLCKNYVDIFIRKIRQPKYLLHAGDSQNSGTDEEDEDEDSSKQSTSFLQKLRAMEEVLTKVQNILDRIASIGERVYNTFIWTVPYLGWLLIIVLSVVTIVLYFIPLRIIVLLWGINKFTKRLRKPNYIPNNEVMDYLSRIPSNIQLDEYREILPESLSPKNSKKRR